MPQAKANGIVVEYESFGRDSDPTVLLIMGFSGQLTMWPLALCEGLAAKGFRVIRFDNRDVGKSTHLSHLPVPNMAEAMGKLMAGQRPDNAPYLLDDMAADATGLLDALDAGPAHIVGASMGGMIAQIVAAKHPLHTRSLVSIMSSTGNPALPMGKPEAMAVLVQPPASDSREDRIAQGIRIWKTIGSPGYPSTEDEVRAFVTTEIDRVPYDPDGPARQMFAIVASEPRNAMLQTVQCPALVIHGADDPLLPVEGGRDTAQSIPGARLEVVPGMAHDFAARLVPTYLRLIGDFILEVEQKEKGRLTMPRIRANGIEIEYAQAGADGGVPLLFINGYTSQMVSWPLEFHDALAAAGLRVIRFDNRDVGLSQKFSGVPDIAAVARAMREGRTPDVAYTLNDMAADAAGLLDALEISTAHIAGCSMGGMIAQLVALNHRDKARSLISIFSTTGDPSLPPATPEAMAALTRPPPSPPERAAAIAHALAGRRVYASTKWPFDEARIGAMVGAAFDRCFYPEGNLRQYAAIVASPPRTERLKALDLPTLVLHGTADTLIPCAAGRHTAACVPGAEYHQIEGWGHDMPVAAVPEITGLIVGFVQAVESGR